MNPARFLCLWLLFSATANAQVVTRRNLADFLGFESTGRADASPIGWGISAPGVAYSDSQTVHSGSLSARIERKATSSGPSSTINLTIPLDFTGTTIRWRGYLKTEDVTGFAALVLQQIGTTSILATASTQNLNVNGTRDWTEYSISLPVNPQARQLTMSVQLAGTGKVWADDLQLTVDNLPVEKAVPLVPTILDTDHEFDQGSGIQLTSLTDMQVKNLATLAKVWGLVKYHHPAVTTGARHWDYDLFRILPTVVNSTSRTAANTAIAGWIGDLGPVADCAPCATLETSDLYMGPDNDWIADESQLGAELSETLQRIHRNRKPTTRQFYISVAAGAVSPTFDNELGYRDIVFPDSGFQLLALFRYWNLVRYFHPDRDVMTADPAEATAYWDAALEDSIRGIALAPDSITYQQELLKFIAKVNDTHANLWSSLATRPPIGACQLPVDIRFIEDQAFVWRYNSLTLGPAASLQPGDVILQLDGIAVAELVEQRKPFYAASNEAVRLRDIAQFLTRGSCGPVQVVVSRDKDVVVLQTERVLSTSLALYGRAPHDLAGPAFQMVANGVAYLKLSAVTASESANYVRSAAGTKGLIIDLRNYPSDFVVFTLGQLLVTNPTPFTLPTTPDLTNPGAFHWMAPITLTPQSPHYDGKVVILIDEVTQSQAEYTTMAFRAAPGSLVIGSTTAGADGNVVLISLPGGFTSYFSGAGVFYADKRPTQRVGIIPDIEIRPTIEAMRAGRDELLEEAILQIIDTPSPGIRFSVPEHGAASSVNAGTGLIPSVGYGVIQPDSGTTPSGLAIFGFRQNGVLVSEASVPAVPLITKGRIYGQISAVVGTGIAIANPSNQNATMSFYFTDGTGTIVSSGTTTIAAKNQIARFLSQAPFNGRSPLSGTFTFESSVPIAVTALRGITNERNEFLLTTLPVTDLQAPLNSGSLLFPHFADGAGWATQLVLVNPTDVLLTGTAQFRDSSGTTVSLRPYSIPPKSSQSLETAGLGSTAVVGSILVSATGGAVPSGLAIFSFRKSGVRVAEAGVPALPSGTAFNLYAEAFGTIQTGIAVANASATAVTVTLEVFNADGSATNLKGSVSIPANGQVAAFVQQIPGLTELKTPFQGTIRVSSSAPIAVVGLRGRYNERSDFLITTTPPVDEAAAPSTEALYFPHLATGGGYSTQFVLFNSRPGQVSIGTLSIFAQTGALMRIR